MVLDEPGAAVSEPVGELDLAQRLGERLRFTQAEPRWNRHFVEQIESHGRRDDDGLAL